MKGKPYFMLNILMGICLAWLFYVLLEINI